MNWELEYLPEAQDDLDALDNSIRQPVIKGIKKVQRNPVSKQEGGYGTPLSETRFMMKLPVDAASMFYSLFALLVN